VSSQNQSQPALVYVGLLFSAIHRADLLASKANERIHESAIYMKLYVGNFSLDMTERTLRELFEPFGAVSEVKLITDRETGQSRGFGLVTMSNVSEGNAAIEGLEPICQPAKLCVYALIRLVKGLPDIRSELMF
jgi:RNA recognition motif-containing protein